MKEWTSYNSQHPVPVVQVDLQGKFVAEFDNIADAAFKNKTSFSQVWKCMSGGQMRAGNSIFIEKSVYNPEKNYSYNWIKKKKQFLKGNATNFIKR
jgi:hypothetical protein